MLADLHLHSDHSDGRLDPAALVDAVADAGISALALTDHDTTAGYRAAQARARGRGVAFVPGIEMTAYAHGRVVHVLGFGCDGDSQALQSANAVAQQVWGANQQAWIAALAAEGAAIDWSRDFVDAPVRLPVLIERLCLANVDGGNPRLVYERFLAFFTALPPQAYHRLPHPSSAAATIHASGGIAMIAHPWDLHVDGQLEALLRDCDGLEAEYGRYSPQQRETLRALAVRHGKSVSGGSDYHGYFEAAYAPPEYEPSDEIRTRLRIKVTPM